MVNVRDAAWVTNETFGAACIFEGDRAEFADVGFTLRAPPGIRYSANARRENP